MGASMTVFQVAIGLVTGMALGEQSLSARSVGRMSIGHEVHRRRLISSGKGRHLSFVLSPASTWRSRTRW